VEIAVKEIAIVVAGCGALTAAGMGLTPLQNAIAANASALQHRQWAGGRTSLPVVAGFVPEATVDLLRAADDAHRDSPVFLFAAAAGREAARQAEEILAQVAPNRRGFVLATTKANIGALSQLVHGQAISAPAQRHIHPAFLAADLAAVTGCRGPVQCVSAACISGLTALQQGAALIRRGRADVVMVTGADVISPFVLSGFQSLKSLDPAGCRPFDKDRAGLSLGEGAATIILAKRELSPGPGILLTGWGTSNDANHLTGPSRDGSGLALAIRRALTKAGLAPADIDYVNAHGTGTLYNDTMESLALRAIFGDHVPPFSSDKGLFGHTMGAAGVLETVVCVLAMQNHLLPGTPRWRERDPAMSAPPLAEPGPVAGLRRILKINCGFGGTNAALVLERAES